MMMWNYILIAQGISMDHHSIFLDSINLSISNDNGHQAHPSALIDMHSTSGNLGLRIPEVSNLNDIINPVIGLLTFNTADTSFYFYTGNNQWMSMSNEVVSQFSDIDQDTYIEVEKNTDDDIIRFIAKNMEVASIDSAARISIKNASGSIIVGEEAGANLNNQASNIAIGRAASKTNTTFEDNVAIGDSALFYNGTNATTYYHSRKNVAIGSEALKNNTSGSENTALGYRSLTNNTYGYANTATGFKTLYSNVSGNLNAAQGFNAMHFNTSGTANSAFGAFALLVNTMGIFNTAFGTSALVSNTVGDSNSIVGTGGSYHNVAGNENVSMGVASNYHNQNGNRNTIIGTRSGYGDSLHNKSGNVFIGFEAGFHEQGDNKLYIENSSSNVPLIYGEFDSDSLHLHANIGIKGQLHLDSTVYLPPLEEATQISEVLVRAPDGSIKTCQSLSCDPLNIAYTPNVSPLGDSLFTSKTNFIIIPGISAANPPRDADGNSYTPVQIGEQIWLSENLNTTKFNNGDFILDASDAGDISGIDKPCYWFEYDENVSSGNGRLYSWEVAIDSRRVCPEGFEVADLDDWHQLMAHVTIGSFYSESKSSKRSVEKSFHHSISLDEFNKMPSRYRPACGSYSMIDEISVWWSATEVDNNSAFATQLDFTSGHLSTKVFAKNSGAVIRCIYKK